MPQAEFAHAPADAPASKQPPANDSAGVPLAVSIFADERALRGQLAEDVEGAGLTVRDCAPLAELLSGPPRPMGEVVLCECPAADAAGLAALARLDERARRAGTHLIVSTGAAALEAVFACCDQSLPQILVDPTRAERAMAVGRALARIPSLRLRDLSQGDRAALLQLNEQLGAIARRLDGGGGPHAIRGEDRVLRFESPAPAFAWQPEAAPPPDPKRVRRMIRQRQLRTRYFDAGLFADPAWDMLLDLTAAAAENTRVSVTSLCIASGVPPTTALRWIAQMVEAGLLRRVPDEADRRRAFIALTEEAKEAMARYFAALDQAPALNAVPEG
jgi:hypothetical protein